MNEHAYLPPSGADAWVPCPMWTHMNASFPDNADPSAIEGHAAHWVLAQTVEGVVIEEGSPTPQGLPVTVEMLEGADLFMDASKSVRATSKEIHVEEQIRGNRFHAELNWGTPDLWAWTPPYLDVFDYKFGYGYVEVFENWQLINYAGLILQALGISGSHDQNVWVRFHIVQPRCYAAESPVRSWTVRASDLRGHFNILAMAAEKASADPTTREAKTGLHCEHCSGRYACPTVRKAASHVVEWSGKSLPVELPPEAVGTELWILRHAREVLDARISGLEQQAESLWKAGTRVPYFRLEPKFGRETWSRSFDEIKVLGELVGVNLVKPALITPAQATKAGLPAELLKQYAKRPPAGMVLVEDDGVKAKLTFQPQPVVK
jgi:hypothetical protein